MSKAPKFGGMIQYETIYNSTVNASCHVQLTNFENSNEICMSSRLFSTHK